MKLSKGAADVINRVLDEALAAGSIAERGGLLYLVMPDGSLSSPKTREAVVDMLQARLVDLIEKTTGYRPNHDEELHVVDSATLEKEGPQW